MKLGRLPEHLGLNSLLPNIHCQGLREELSAQAKVPPRRA